MLIALGIVGIIGFALVLFLLSQEFDGWENRDIDHIEDAAMTQPRQPKLLDLVAVTNCPAGEPIEIGDVGTVMELLPPDGLEVEFLDRDGRTRCVATLTVADVLVLNRERTRVA